MRRVGDRDTASRQFCVADLSAVSPAMPSISTHSMGQPRGARTVVSCALAGHPSLLLGPRCCQLLYPSAASAREDRAVYRRQPPLSVSCSPNEAILSKQTGPTSLRSPRCQGVQRWDHAAGAEHLQPGWLWRCMLAKRRLSI